MASICESTVNGCIPIRCASPELIQCQKCSEKSGIFVMGVTMWKACSKATIPRSKIETNEELCQHVTSGKTLVKPITCSNEA